MCFNDLGSLLTSRTIQSAVVEVKLWHFFLVFNSTMIKTLLLWYNLRNIIKIRSSTCLYSSYRDVCYKVQVKETSRDELGYVENTVKECRSFKKLNDSDFANNSNVLYNLTEFRIPKEVEKCEGSKSKKEAILLRLLYGSL